MTRALLLLVVLLALLAQLAHADVRREGDWPNDSGEPVSLAFDGTRSEAIRRLAQAAGWSVVGSALKDEPVSVHVIDQPAGKVLALLLGDGDYVVKRDGKLLSISAAPHGKQETADPSAAPSWPKPDPIPPPPAAGKQRGRGDDRTVLGGRAVVAQGETVGDLLVLGGSAEIFGTVSGDAAVFGGTLQVRSGGHVHGDVAVLGGMVHLEDGARVDGDISTAGGRVERAAGALIGGDLTGAVPGNDHRDADDEADEQRATAPEKERKNEEDDDESTFAVGDVGSAIARTALLFAFGCVLLSLAGARMELMQQELAARPVRAFALGVVGLLAGALGLIALCVTIIGIPLAIVAALLGLLGVYAGMCAAFTALGAAILHERTPSPYVHLGFGCAVYLLTSSLPVIGWLATVAAVLIGLGLLVETRGAGVFARGAALPEPQV